MNRKIFKKDPISQPGEESGKRLKLFMKTVERKYNQKFGDYWDFHKWTTENITEFWAEIWDYGDLIYSKSYDKVIDLSIPMEESPRWFEGARLNFAENLLKFRDDRTALISAGEDKGVERVSFKQLYEETRVYAAALRKFGLQKGDRVACYMSNRKEAAIAMLAVTSIGAIWSGGLPILGPKAYLDRLKQVTPKILFTIDQFPYNKEVVHLLQNIKEITEGLPSLKKVIIIPSKSKLQDISDIRNGCLLDDFLRTAYDTSGNLPDLVFEQVSFSHPVFINFTSGTTGPPKTIVHGFGALFGAIRDFWLHWDGEENDITLSMSPVGWATWNIFINVLFSGSAVLLFEGVPHFVTPTYLWDLVDELKITKLFMIPSVLDKMEMQNYVPNKKHDLSSLKMIICGGNIANPKNCQFLMDKVKKSIRFVEAYGSTELMASGLVNDETLPIYPGEISSPSFGVAIECLDDGGHNLLGEMGEFVITRPVPSLPLKLWGDTSGEEFKKTYFSKFPGKFYTGDLIIINPVTKGLILCGRSDTVLKHGNFRFGSSEIYEAVKLFPEIRDSLCVAQYSNNRDQRAVLFIQMQEGQPFNKDLVNRLKSFIVKELSDSHVPKVILEVPEIPYNANGKKAEISVKKIINNRPHDPEMVANPACLEFYYNIPDLQGF